MESVEFKQTPVAFCGPGRSLLFGEEIGRAVTPQWKRQWENDISHTSNWLLGRLRGFCFLN